MEGTVILKPQSLIWTKFILEILQKPLLMLEFKPEVLETKILTAKIKKEWEYIQQQQMLDWDQVLQGSKIFLKSLKAIQEQKFRRAFFIVVWYMFFLFWKSLPKIYSAISKFPKKLTFDES